MCKQLRSFLVALVVAFIALSTRPVQGAEDNAPPKAPDTAPPDSFPRAAPSAGLPAPPPSQKGDRAKVEDLLRESNRLKREFPKEKSTKKSRQKKKGAKGKPKKDQAELDSRARAEQELLVPAAMTTSAIVMSPATIEARVAPVEPASPARGLRLGASVRPYRPLGRFEVPGFASYDLGELGVRPLTSLEARWAPFAQTPGGASWGFFIRAGYAQHEAILRGATIVEVDRARIHTVETMGGLLVERNLGPTSRWSVAGEIGLGRQDRAQAGRSARSEASQSMAFAEISAALQNEFFPGWKGFAAYRRVAPLRAENADMLIERNQLVGGLIGRVW